MAWARTYDLYRAAFPKGAFCAAIGGACASDDDPENSFYENPAALEASHPDFVYDADFYASGNSEPGMKSDNDVNETTLSAGFARAGEKWGLGFAFYARFSSVKSRTGIQDDQGNIQNISLKTTAETYFFHLPVAYRINDRLSLGVSLLGIFHSESFDLAQGKHAKGNMLDPSPSLGLSVGGIYRLNDRFRFGSWLRAPLNYYLNLNINTSYFGSTINYNEDIALHYPWLWASGVSYLPWADDRTLFLDLNLIGATNSGYVLTYDNFAGALSDKNLRAKGRDVMLEPRLGWRSAWSRASKGTYLLGSYWEDGRTQGYSGRLHGTAGVAYKVTTWFETLVGADVSRNFFQLLITFR